MVIIEFEYYEKLLDETKISAGMNPGMALALFQSSFG
jgi:hypothetical protein